MSQPTTSSKPLVILTVFFGPLPPWLPLTLHSMAANAPVDFVVVGDAPPPAVLPPNVRFERIGYEEMQRRLAALTSRPVKYTNTYKANDIKPFLPALYPSAFTGYDWWGWADLDVVFGDLLKFLRLAEPHPACCRGLEINCNKRARRDPTSPCFNSSRPQIAADTYFDRRACTCQHGEVVTAVSPLYPNPWRKKCWGPFTLFKGSITSQHGWSLFRESPKWKDIVSEAGYTHFDEWWGPFTQRGYETMGDVMTRLSDEGRLIMSRTWLPFSEAKSCVDIECTFCPCGATRMTLRGKTLLVNDEESMILHLAESKHNWARAAAALSGGSGARWDADQSFGSSATSAATLAAKSVSEGPWALPAYVRGSEATGVCYDVLHLGSLNEDTSLSHVGGTAVAATRYARHRPASSKAAATIVYYARNGSEASKRTPQLVVRPCSSSSSNGASSIGSSSSDAFIGGGVGGGSIESDEESTDAAAASVAMARAKAALAELTARYDAYTSAERMRTLAWLCGWQRLSAAYMESVATVDMESAISKRLPLVHGNRRVRTPMYGGERLGWWRQTVNMSEAASDGPCQADSTAPCPLRKWPEVERAKGSGRKGGKRRNGHGRSLLQQRSVVEAISSRSQTSPPRLWLPGRSLRAIKAKRVSRYDLNTPPVPGVACLPLETQASTLREVHEQVFSVYLQLQHARRAEYGRTQRWMCSWLYKLRACDDAERAQKAQPIPLGQGRCRKVEPPDEQSEGLGWRGYKVNAMIDLAPLLYGFRCW